MAIFGSLLTDLAVFCLTVGLYVYINMRNKYNSYKKRGIKCFAPLEVMLYSLRTLSGRYTFGSEYMEIYKKFKDEPVAVVGLGSTPVYVAIDPEVVQDILTTNFSQFHDRGFTIDEKTNPLEGHLFSLSGQKWRFLRNKLSPTFTSGKLKGMYPLVNSCGEILVDVLKDKVDDVEVKDLMACFTTDVIGSCAFGIEPTAMYSPDCEFRVMGKKVFSQSLKTIFLNFIRFTFPKLFIKLKIKTVPDDLNNFFFGLIRGTFEKRLKGEKRNDFVQLLLQLREKGHVEVGENDEEFKELDTKDLHYKKTFDLTDEVLTAQAFIFYFAGFETTATAMSFALYLLSKNQEVQERAREEVREMKAKYGGINYQSVKEMVYLQACLDETLRLYPPVNMLFRQAKHTFTLDQGIVIDKGALVIIPVAALQSDPRFFSNPDQFDPERFMPEASVVPGSYIPFGDGPRSCIGKRFAIVEAKSGLASVLDNFRLELSDKTREPLEMDPKSSFLSPIGGLWVKFVKINDE